GKPRASRSFPWKLALLRSFHPSGCWLPPAVGSRGTSQPKSVMPASSENQGKRARRASPPGRLRLGRMNLLHVVVSAETMAGRTGLDAARAGHGLGVGLYLGGVMAAGAGRCRGSDRDLRGDDPLIAVVVGVGRGVFD